MGVATIELSVKNGASVRIAQPERVARWLVGAGGTPGEVADIVQVQPSAVEIIRPRGRRGISAPAFESTVDKPSETLSSFARTILAEGIIGPEDEVTVSSYRGRSHGTAATIVATAYAKANNLAELGDDGLLKTLTDLSKPFVKDTVASLFSAHESSIFGYVLNRTKDHDLAADITNETMIRALRHVGSKPGIIANPEGSDGAAWLMTIAGNLLRDHWKSSKRLEVSSEILEVDTSVHGTPVLGPEDKILSGVAQQGTVNLADALASLTEEQRELIAAKYFDDLSVDDLAEHVGRNVSATKALTHRTLRKLARLLTQPDEGKVHDTSGGVVPTAPIYKGINISVLQRALTPKEQAIYLAYMDGMDIDDIGAEFGLSPESVTRAADRAGSKYLAALKESGMGHRAAYNIATTDIAPGQQNAITEPAGFRLGDTVTLIPDISNEVFAQELGGDLDAKEKTIIRLLSEGVDYTQLPDKTGLKQEAIERRVTKIRALTEKKFGQQHQGETDESEVFITVFPSRQLESIPLAGLPEVREDRNPGSRKRRAAGETTSIILAALKEHGGMTREQLSKRTGISVHSLLRSIRRLMTEGKLVEAVIGADAPTANGKRPKLLRVAGGDGAAAQSQMDRNAIAKLAPYQAALLTAYDAGRDITEVAVEFGKNPNHARSNLSVARRNYKALVTK